MPADVTSRHPWAATARITLERCQASPTGFFEQRDGPQAERTYLTNLGESYIDTVVRVGQELDMGGKTRPRVLEIGALCGVVSLSLSQAGCEVTAQDLPEVLAHPGILQRFTAAGIAIAPVADLTCPLPYPDAAFDVVICCELMEHLPFNPVRFLQELRRITAPDGFLFLSVPNIGWIAKRLNLLRGNPIHDSISELVRLPDSNNWHWREYLAAELHELLAASGFSKVKVAHRHYHTPAHPNLLHRLAVDVMYRLYPSFLPNLCAVAR